MTSTSIPVPATRSVDDGAVTLASGALAIVGSATAGWTLMSAEPESMVVVWESFTDPVGEMAVIGPDGRELRLAKSAEATTVDPDGLYLGHQLEAVLRSEHDLLGRELLAGDGDPEYSAVAGCLPPIRRAAQYTFVGHGATADKVGIEYGGRTPNFDPAILAPEIAQLRERGMVRDGLVGGWLPAVRFVFGDGPTWWEYVVFAPPHSPHVATQPVWYRVARVDDGRLAWVRYVDSYVPTPVGAEADGSSFYRDLVALADQLEIVFAGGMSVELPDRRLADQARHSLTRALITRVGGFPKYGILDRLYGAAEHDGFQDTFNADSAAAIEWGLLEVARAHIDNYFEHFVRDDGSLWYRGTETGQSGRMLTTVAQYLARSGDLGPFERHRRRITAVVDVLRRGHELARATDREDPAYGVISGWCEADSCLEADPARYWQPYLSNSAEAARGFVDLGRALAAHPDPSVAAWAGMLVVEGEELREELLVAIERSRFDDVEPPCIPVVAGASAPFHIAVAADMADPQFRAYRANMELLHSGVLDADDVRTIVDYREAHRDVVVGVPCAYGFIHGPSLADHAPEMAGFLSYGHGYGLLQHGMIREFLLLLWSLSAHQYTRGTWTAPETRLVDPEREVISYAVPAQVAVGPARAVDARVRAAPAGRAVVAAGGPAILVRDRGAGRRAGCPDPMGTRVRQRDRVDHARPGRRADRGCRTRDGARRDSSPARRAHRRSERGGRSGAPFRRRRRVGRAAPRRHRHRARGASVGELTGRDRRNRRAPAGPYGPAGALRLRDRRRGSVPAWIRPTPLSGTAPIGDAGSRWSTSCAPRSRSRTGSTSSSMAPASRRCCAGPTPSPIRPP